MAVGRRDGDRAGLGERRTASVVMAAGAMMHKRS